MERTKNIVLIVFSLGFGLVMAELLASLASKKNSVFWDNPLMMMYPVNVFDPKVTADTLHENNDPHRAVKFVPDDHRWYRLDPEPPIPESGRLVLNFGDSSTWGWGLVDRNRAYPSYLNEILPKGTQSINLGVPGYSSLQGLHYAQELLPKYSRRIAAVTLYFGNNDATENGASDAAKLAQETQSVHQGKQWLAQFALYRLLRSAIAAIHSRRANNIPRVDPSEYQQNLTAVVRLCRTYGIRVIIVEPRIPLSWPPAHVTFLLSLQAQVRNPWSSAELTRSLQLYHNGLDRLYYHHDDSYEPLLLEAVEHDWVIPRIKSAWLKRLRLIENLPGVTVIRLPQIFIGAEYPYSFEDYCHPSAGVHAQIAELIAKAL